METVGCSGMTHSATMACEILPGKTVLEAVNTDLVCDAINVAMREIFKQFIYGRTQTGFSDGGLPVGAALDALGRAVHSQREPGILAAINPLGIKSTSASAQNGAKRTFL